MELSKKDTKILKGIAILLMILLHLFATKKDGLYSTFPLINDTPLVYYIALLGDACVPIYLFVTGYAFYIINNNSNVSVLGKNLKRILKLYINFWVVFIIFVPLGFQISKHENFTFNIITFILSIFGMSNSYNGAWWYLQIYIIFVLFSPFLIKIVKKYNPLVILFISSIIYVVSHFQRYRGFIDFGDNTLVLELIRVMFLLGTSQISFFIGAIFSKEKVLSNLHKKIQKIRFRNIISTICIVLLIVFHAIIESAIIAPINGIAIIIIYWFMNKNKVVEKILDYISNHSTNIWLIHMFFYMSIFPELTFAPRNPLLIFFWLLILCIVSSYAVNFITNPIIRVIDRKIIYRSKGYSGGFDRKGI
ncbi:acyltransferase [Bacillus sp. SA1-12]|uniref:acyltransferase family protein n=1 Tax=Bacillus sp. SA1-12 TaxID=1455638 RepID=UPI00062589E9|nr:acyltransferase [Bacillus sp. SA1-12]KKI91430.1 acyltransferase [Bacillus sp. SA1-12]